MRKADKPRFAKLVHDHMRSLNPPARFLKRASDNDPYIDIGIRLAIKKTSQSLREGAPEILKKIETGKIMVKVYEKASFESSNKHMQNVSLYFSFFNCKISLLFPV